MKNIEWAERTWNPLTGCKRGCTWTAPGGKVVECYAKTICERFKHQPRFDEPVWHEDRLMQPFKWRKPSRIFVCSMADLFGYWVRREYIHNVLNVASKLPQHIFLLLTKNPKRLMRFDYPPNCWAGATVDTNNLLLPTGAYAAVRWVSFEPLVNDVWPSYPRLKWLVDWVVIGALSAGAKKYQPKREWVEHILEAAEGLPVFMKDNLDCEALGIERRQEYPEGGVNRET